MMLSELLKNCPLLETRGSLAHEFSELQYDSRRVAKGDAFFALRGIVSDGHDYIASAVASGCMAVICEEIPEMETETVFIQVDNSRRAMAIAAANFYRNPTRNMQTIGVTGTNGKTTITYLLEAILEHAGMRPAVVGTINYRYGNDLRQAPHTTPESLDLMKQVNDFRNNGASSLVMEVSSHALEQSRVDGVHFEVGIFTNLTPEHLDYHIDMENYFNSKVHLFKELLPRDMGRGVINVDDPYGQRLFAEFPDALTCSRSRDADIFPDAIDVSLKGIHGVVKTPLGPVTVNSTLLGEYNVENILCAIGGAIALGIKPGKVSAGLASSSGVPGRLEQIENDRDAVVLVDYAHTGDALKRVLEAMQELAPKRILTVFGCGGDRDRSKRAVMARVAAKNSDIAIATSDNPRTENPQQILADIRLGLAEVHAEEWSRDDAVITTGNGYFVIEDRREAIEFAVSLLQPDDLLLVAGKGHEDYQILNSGRIHFDDREELRRALQGGGIQ